MPRIRKADDRYHHGNLREALVSSAHGLLRSDGVSGLSMRKVAAKAGVSAAAPYHHFKDKDSLLAALVQSGFTRLISSMTDHSVSSQPFIGRFEHMGQSYVRFAMASPHLYALMFGAGMLDKDKHPGAACAADGAFEMLVEVIRAGQAEGVVAGAEPRPVALATWSMVHGLASLLIDKMHMVADDGDGGGPMSTMPVDAIIEAVLRTLTMGVIVRDEVRASRPA